MRRRIASPVTTTNRSPWLKPPLGAFRRVCDDPLDHLAIDRLVGVVPHHLPAPQNVGKLHGAHDDGHDAHGRRPAAGHCRPGAPRLPRRGEELARPRALRLRTSAPASRSSSSTRSRRRAAAGSPSGSPTTPTSGRRSRCRRRRSSRPRTSGGSGCRPRRFAGIPDLMHHKYVVRDLTSVWTGSTNWTDDSWSREENVIAVLDSPALARAFHAQLRGALDDGDRRDAQARSSRARCRWTGSRCAHGSAPASATRSPTGSQRRSGGRSAACGSARR